MAGRSTRRLIQDRLRQASKFCDDSINKLAEVQQVYFDEGYPHGAELEMVREALTLTRESIDRFRKERA